jgi:tight adherence protein C
MTLVAITFLTCFVLVASGGLLLFNRSAILGRLSEIVDRREGPPEGLFSRLRRRNPASVQQIVKPFQNLLPRSPAEVSVIQKRLIRAGYRSDAHLNGFYAAKVLVPLSLCLAATLTQAYEMGAFFVYGIAGGLGFLVPDFWLGNRISNRQRELRCGLPEALDLLVVCSEAGLGLDQSLARVAAEMRVSQPVIYDELNLLILEQKAGRPRDEALKNLAERTDVPSIRALVNTLIQADTFGASIAKSLRVYSDTMRVQRRQQAEEQAAKTTVKLVFPLVFLIFPSIFVVALGPALLSATENFKKYLMN